jgi:hypothetical protein
MEVAPMASAPATPYPVRYDVDYPERLDRLSSVFRLIWIIPIAIVLGLVSGSGSASDAGNDTSRVVIGAGGLLVAGPLVMILFRRKYPRWWFDWNLELSRFSARVFAYLFLLRDEYPSTDERQNVHLDIDYPDAQRDLNRWMPLVKWLLAVPHYVVLFFLFIGVFLAVIGAWFSILFTGGYPRPLFDYVVGVVRWAERVAGYAFLLVTDRYPPFSLR